MKSPITVGRNQSMVKKKTKTFQSLGVKAFTIATFTFHIQSYFYNDDNFNFNYAQAKAAVGNFKEAEEVK